MEFTPLIKFDVMSRSWTGLLLARAGDSRELRRQLSRWTNTGRLYQLRRGLDAFALPFPKVKPHPFVVANRIGRGSYVGC